MREKKKFLFFFKQIVFYLSLPGANSHLECVRNPSYSNCSCVEVWRSGRRCLKYKLVQQATSEEESFLLGKGLAQALPLSYTKGHHCHPRTLWLSNRHSSWNHNFWSIKPYFTSMQYITSTVSHILCPALPDLFSPRPFLRFPPQPLRSLP
jgi:hypothetical protein